jgi:hypothetical protein
MVGYRARRAHWRVQPQMVRRPRIIPLSRLSGARPTSLPISRRLSRPSSGNSFLESQSHQQRQHGERVEDDSGERDANGAHWILTAVLAPPDREGDGISGQAKTAQYFNI